MTRAALRIINHTSSQVSLRLTLDGCLLARFTILERGGQLLLQRGAGSLEAAVELHAPSHHSISPRYRLTPEAAHLLILERQRPQSSPALDVLIERSSAPNNVCAENTTEHPALVRLHLPALALPLQLVVAPSSCATLRLLAPLCITAFCNGIAAAPLEIDACEGVVEIRQLPDLSIQLHHLPSQS